MAVLFLIFLSGCQKYLNIVPDDVPTIENAFTLRQEAIKYLGTCYSYLPNGTDFGSNSGISAGGEYWINPSFTNVGMDGIKIIEGFQNSNSPYMSNWNTMYQAIRDCNIFLDNVNNVVDLQPYEKKRWIGEVTFLKGYYHWLLFQQYGPVPVVDVNLPISASPDEVRVTRFPVDSVVNYIVSLFDEAAEDLPLTILDATDELGRITKPAALAIKARVLTTAASPLFNGNTYYSGLKNQDGQLLFSSTYDATKWKRAADACAAAIKVCDSASISLYTFSDPQTSIDETLTTQMSIRNALCAKWNQELIWGDATHRANDDVQRFACPRLDPARIGNDNPQGELAPSLQTVEGFYTKNGVPVDEDKTWDYSNRYRPKTIPDEDGETLQNGYETAQMNLDREPRFYADLSFDGDRWWKQDGSWDVQCKQGQNQAQKNVENFSTTGYFTKKIVSWKFVIQEGQSTSTEDYPWPVMRLADLYLLYAESLNESYPTPPDEAFTYINKVRERAGLPTVQEAWTQYSRVPSEYTTQVGFRKIIQQERLNELAFEGRRFWDLQRWKRLSANLNKPITGWNILASTESGYYVPVTLFTPSFNEKNYLWPISDNDILINKKLVQNTGW